MVPAILQLRAQAQGKERPMKHAISAMVVNTEAYLDYLLVSASQITA